MSGVAVAPRKSRSCAEPPVPLPRAGCPAGLPPRQCVGLGLEVATPDRTVTFSAEVCKEIQKFLSWGRREEASLLRDSLLPALVSGVYARYCETMLHSIMTTRLSLLFLTYILNRERVSVHFGCAKVIEL